MKKQIEALKESNAELIRMLEKIKDGCDAVRHLSGIHSDARSLAREVIRDCSTALRKAQGGNND